MMYDYNISKEFLLNFKQHELVGSILNDVLEHYPEVEFVSLQRNPDDINHIWINVQAPMDEDRELELMSYGAGLCTDILLDYGYAFSLMTENPTVQLS
jgi:hypothetical protein